MTDSNNDPSALLLTKMSKDPDTLLIFDGVKGKETVKAHAILLTLHSPVLEQAMICCSSSEVKHPKGKTNCNGTAWGGSPGHKMPMPGTSKADFLVVAQFLYPVVPLPKVSWDNLEVLLVEGQKWDIQVVIALAAEFLQANAASLDLTPSSNKYAFKWLQLADAARLTDACKACADRIIALDRSSFKAEQLECLSRQILMYIIEEALIDGGPDLFSKPCSYCRCTREFQVTCTRCSRR